MPHVTAPVAGEVRALSDVPDPVFADGMVGGGVAIDPWAHADTDARRTVVAPITGTIVKMFPHAFVISGEAGDVLVHLGLGTVGLRGEGFEVFAHGGDDVEEGQPVVVWDATPAREAGLNTWVIVCGLGTPPAEVVLADGIAPSSGVTQGAPLLILPERQTGTGTDNPEARSPR